LYESGGRLLTEDMSIASIDDALAQYSANLIWHTSRSAAESALEALRYLKINRPQRLDDSGSTINYESIEAEILKIETFLGATTVRAFGRNRRVLAGFVEETIQ
jgi:hypothetical protein